MRRTVLATFTSASAALLLAGCASTAVPATSATDLAVGATDLSAACPATVVIQTNWMPTADSAYIYELLGPDATTDANTAAVAGPLFAEGEYTGVDVEIRAGGPAIGYQTVQSQMYADKDITLGFVPTDNQIATSADLPVVSVMAPLDRSPLMIMWDPATYPDVKTIADLGETGAVVRYYGGAPYMEYLVESGQLDRDQIDAGYDGAPANFVAAGGADAQQGFVTSEPYLYENDIAEWAKPVAYQMVGDAGYEYYESTLAVRPDALADLDACLSSLIPVIQQAEADFYADPTATLELVTEISTELSDGVPLTLDAARAGIDLALTDGLVANGPDGALGSFDADRVASVLDIVEPILSASGAGIAEGLTAEDLYTNEYIDTTISLAP